MTNKQKIKGTTWERDVANLLNDLLNSSEWKRIPGSGAMGTILGESNLMGDVKGKVDWLYKPFLLEAKVGYGGSKQLTIKKEWFDKIAEEAEIKNAFPAVVCKFSGARSGVRNFIAFDLEVFVELMKEGNKILLELEKVYKENGTNEQELDEGLRVIRKNVRYP